VWQSGCVIAAASMRVNGGGGKGEGDVVPPCVGARIATLAGARFHTFDAIDGPDLGMDSGPAVHSANA